MNKKEQIEYLSKFVTKNRINNFNKLINYRTKYITIVLEDIFQSHNASAAIRSCECLGIQDVHIIENTNKYQVNPDVVLGASKWLSLIKYNERENNTITAINKLKKQKYRIVATSPHENNISLHDLDLNKGKIALVFGSEMPGISEIVKKNADEFIYIPMCGFTESFNISVSVAICLFELSNKLRKSEINWQLSKSEKQTLFLEWLKQSVKKSDEILKRIEG